MYCLPNLLLAEPESDLNEALERLLVLLVLKVVSLLDRLVPPHFEDELEDTDLELEEDDLDEKLDDDFLDCAPATSPLIADSNAVAKTKRTTALER